MSMMVNPYWYGGTADPSFSSTVLLIGCNGADGATVTSDESAAARGAAAFTGNAQLDTAQTRFGTSSLLLDGSGDLISWTDATAGVRFDSGDFTVEAWIRFNSLTGFQTIASKWNTLSNQAWLFDFPGSANNLLRFAYSTTGSNTTAVQGAWTPSTGIWYHVAASRVGNTLYLFAGTTGTNTLIASASVSGVTIHSNNTGLRIGTILSSGSESNGFNGWIDELRITKAGRYSGTFTVPTAAFPRS